jgi:hypothetical protein
MNGVIEKQILEALGSVGASRVGGGMIGLTPRCAYVPVDAANGFVLFTPHHNKPHVFKDLDSMIEFIMEDVPEYFKAKFAHELEQEQARAAYQEREEKRAEVPADVDGGDTEPTPEPETDGVPVDTVAEETTTDAEPV